MTKTQKNAAKTLDEVLEIIRSLQDVYEEETRALESADVSGFLNLQGRKIEVTTHYQKGVERLMEHREEIKALSPDIKKKLEKMQADFTAMSNRNLEALKRMQRCTKRLGEKIYDAARQSARKNSAVNYGDKGTLENMDKRPLSMGISETA